MRTVRNHGAGLFSDRLALALLLVGSSLLVLPACRYESRDIASSLKLQGEIDTTAAPQAQTKQKIIRQLLKAINEGASDKGSLAIHAADIDFREAEAAFLDGHAWLARWDFDGPVSGNDVPVTLYFSDREFDFGDPSNHIETHRIYSVKQSGSKAVVTRVK